MPKALDVRTHGGRVIADAVLSALGRAVNCAVPFSIAISADAVAAITGADDVPAAIDDFGGSALAETASTFRERGFLPVLKSSFVANDFQNQLSFAGVGTTAVARDPSTEQMRAAFAQVGQGHQNPVAVYYRIAHPQARTGAMGLLVQQFLEGQALWGSAWRVARGMFLSIARSTSGGRQQFRARCRDGMPCDDDVPDWLDSRMLTSVQVLIADIAACPLSGTEFELEFAISLAGKITLMQWRPIPRTAQMVLNALLDDLDLRLWAAPYSEVIFPAGERVAVRPAEMPIEVLAERIRKDAGRVWVVPYGNAGAELVRLLMALWSEPGLLLPPAIVVHGPEEALRHVHALCPEDERVGHMVHVTGTVEKYSD